MTPAELAARRSALGWTMTDLANRSGVSLATVSRIEAGKHRQGPHGILTKLLDAALTREERKQRRRARRGGEA